MKIENDEFELKEVKNSEISNNKDDKNITDKNEDNQRKEIVSKKMNENENENDCKDGLANLFAGDEIQDVKMIQKQENFEDLSMRDIPEKNVEKKQHVIFDKSNEMNVDSLFEPNQSLKGTIEGGENKDFQGAKA